MVRSEETVFLSSVAMSALVAHGTKVANHCYGQCPFNCVAPLLGEKWNR
jgi:hypothetical protein